MCLSDDPNMPAVSCQQAEKRQEPKKQLKTYNTISVEHHINQIPQSIDEHGYILSVFVKDNGIP